MARSCWPWQAERRGLLFEASVGGGTPVITPLHQCLAANQISQIQGIVNGTTNFMLTKMARENMGFDQALKIAQDLGYAETKDPRTTWTAPTPAARSPFWQALPLGGMFTRPTFPPRASAPITVADIAAAAGMDCAIKLIAWARRDEGGQVAAGVEPMLVPRQNQLAGVDDVFNAVLMKGDMLGDVVFTARARAGCPPPARWRRM